MEFNLYPENACRRHCGGTLSTRRWAAGRGTLLFFLGDEPVNVTTEVDLPDAHFTAGARQALMKARSYIPGCKSIVRSAAKL